MAMPITSRVLSCAFTLAVLLPGCGKREAPAPATPQPSEAAQKPVPPTAPPPPPPPPELGIPLESFVSARVLDLCAQKFGEPHDKGERLAAGLLQGRKPVVNLDLALPPEPVKVDKKHAKPAPLPQAATTTEAPEDVTAREKYLKAVALAEAHTPTQQRVAAQVEKCLYAPELGLIEQELIDRYVATFVEIACLQRELLGPDGKLDVTAHAQAAVKVFVAHQFNAGDFARMGLVFARFPTIQGQVQSEKAKRCQDPRVEVQKAASTGEWTGGMTGDRNAALHVTAREGNLEGAVQWLGVPKKTDVPGTQPAIPVTGALSGTTINLFGQVGNDWVRLTGKMDDKGFSGTWQGEVDLHKLKGAFQAQRLPPPARSPSEQDQRRP
jgi:hypothetical protein